MVYFTCDLEVKGRNCKGHMWQFQRSRISRSNEDYKERQVGSQQHQVASSIDGAIWICVLKHTPYLLIGLFYLFFFFFKQIVDHIIRSTWTEICLDKFDDDTTKPVTMSLPAVHLAFQHVTQRLNDFTTIVRLLKPCLENVKHFIEEPSENYLKSTEEMVCLF